MDLNKINHLSEIARIELSSQEKEKIALDLKKVLEYVKQLEKVDTKEIKPMIGGTTIENIYRDDEKINQGFQKQEAKEQLRKVGFDSEGDYFKIPPIF